MRLLKALLKENIGKYRDTLVRVSEGIRFKRLF